MGLPGPTHNVPPAGIVVGIVPGDVRIARQGVADQHGVVARGVELAVGLVGHGHFRQRPPCSSGSGSSNVTDCAYCSGRELRDAVAAFKKISLHSSISAARQDGSSGRWSGSGVSGRGQWSAARVVAGLPTSRVAGLPTSRVAGLPTEPHRPTEGLRLLGRPALALGGVGDPANSQSQPKS